MATVDDIKAQIKSVASFDRLLTFREVQHLPKILADDERVEAVLAGFYKGGNGLLVATRRRLIFLDKGLLYGLRIEEFPLAQITSIEHKTGLLMGKVIIFAAGNRAEISMVEKAQVQPFLSRLEYLRRPDATQAGPIGRPAVDELERLASLRARGALTEEEFAVAKQKALGA